MLAECSKVAAQAAARPALLGREGLLDMEDLDVEALGESQDAEGRAESQDAAAGAGLPMGEAEEHRDALVSRDG